MQAVLSNRINVTTTAVLTNYAVELLVKLLIAISGNSCYDQSVPGAFQTKAKKY